MELRVLAEIPETITDPTEVTFSLVMYKPGYTTGNGVKRPPYIAPVVLIGDSSKENLERHLENIYKRAKEAFKKPVLTWDTKLIELPE